jgi:hypothetical protein
MQSRRRGRYLLGAAVVVVALVVAGLYVGTHALKSKVEQALGPTSEIGAIHVRWNAVEIEHLRIKAAAGWPAKDELRAERIRVEPDLRGLLSRQIRIGKIEIGAGYLSALRGNDGRLRLLPSLLEHQPAAGAAPLPNITVGRVELVDASLDFFDATVKKPPLRLRLEQLHATVDDVLLPDFKGRTRLDMQGTVKGVRKDGTLSIKGWVEIASKDSSLVSRLRDVDLIALQPYLIKAAETGVKKGTLDLDIDAEVKNKQLRAPGTLTLNDLELDEGGSTFMGMPRKAVVSMMQDRERKITVKFELAGNLGDPQFKLNENLASRLGSSLASSLGISFEGIAKGANSVGEVLGGATEGVGKAIKGLFGK